MVYWNATVRDGSLVQPMPHEFVVMHGGSIVAVFMDLRDAARWVDEEATRGRTCVVAQQGLQTPKEYCFSRNSANSFSQAPSDTDMREWLRTSQNHVFFTVQPMLGA